MKMRVTTRMRTISSISLSNSSLLLSLKCQIKSMKKTMKYNNNKVTMFLLLLLLLTTLNKLKYSQIQHSSMTHLCTSSLIIHFLLIAMPVLQQLLRYHKSTSITIRTLISCLKSKEVKPPQADITNLAREMRLLTLKTAVKQLNVLPPCEWKAVTATESAKRQIFKKFLKKKRKDVKFRTKTNNLTTKKTCQTNQRF